MKEKTKGKKEWKDEDYIDHPEKWGSKEEYKIVKETLEELEDKIDWRQNSCPFPTSDATVIVDGTTVTPSNGGKLGDWTPFWDRSAINYRMVRDVFNTNRSNLKSPTSFAVVEAYMSEFQEINNTIKMSPTHDEDSDIVKFHEKLQEHWENKRNVLELKYESALKTAIYGTNVPFIGYKMQTRKVDILLTGNKTKKEAERLKKEYDEEKDEAIGKILKENKPFTEKEEIWEYNDCIYVPTSIYDVYVDRGATCIEGPDGATDEVIWVQTVPLKKFKNEFKNIRDAYVVKANIDKVKGMGEMNVGTDTLPFFNVNEKDIKGDMVRIVRRYIKSKDKYYIVANDVLIRKGPLPYNHGNKKKLPFARHRLYILDDCFYGVGFPGYLESLQAEVETERNGHLDIMKINNGRKLFIPNDNDEAEEIDEQWDNNEVGQKILASRMAIEGMRWSESIPYMPDHYQTMQALEQDITKVSGVNPILLSTPKAGEPVRNNLMANESSIKNMKKLIKNYMVGYKEAVWQNVFNRIQFMPEAYANEIKPDPIKIEDMIVEVEKDDEGNESMYIEEKEGEVTYIDNVTEKMLYLKDCDVELNIDALAPVSQGLKMQNAREAFTLFSQLPPEMRDDPLIVEMMREIITTSGFNQKMLLTLQEGNDKQSVEEAIEQHKLIIAYVTGKSQTLNLQGKPGASLAHRYTHMLRTMELLAVKEEASQLLNPDTTPLNQMEKAQEKLMMIDRELSILSKHMSEDSMPKSKAPEIIAQAAMPQPPMGMQPPMGGDPMMGQMPPEAMMGGGGPPMPMNPMGGAGDVVNQPMM